MDRGYDNFAIESGLQSLINYQHDVWYNDVADANVNDVAVDIDVWHDKAVDVDTCGQSYKQFMIIIYESRVVIWAIF